MSLHIDPIAIQNGSNNVRNTFLDEKSAAAMLQVSPNTLRSWRRDGKGPRYHKLGSKVRYALAEIRAFIRGSIVDRETSTEKMKPSDPTQNHPELNMLQFLGNNRNLHTDFDLARRFGIQVETLRGVLSLGMGDPKVSAKIQGIYYTQKYAAGA